MVKLTRSSFLAVWSLISEATAQSFTTSCTGNALATPAPKNFRCGAQGTLSNPSILQSAQETSADVCRDQCLAQLECISYSYNPTESACTLYSSTLVKQGLQRARTGTHFYNRKCFVTCLDTFSLQATGPASASFNKAFAVNSDDGPEPVLVFGHVYNADVYALNNVSFLYKPATGYVLTFDPDSLNQAPLIMNYTDAVAEERGPVDCYINPDTILSCSARSAEGAYLDLFFASGSVLEIGYSRDSGEIPLTFHVLPPYPQQD